MKRMMTMFAVALVASVGIQFVQPRDASAWASWRTGDPSGRTKTWGQSERGAVSAIAWSAGSPQLFTAAVENSQIVILYFGNREDDDEFFSGIDVAEMAKAGLVLCVRVREPEVKGDKPVAIVPTSRLAADDKWAAYGIEKADTFIVADRYGNEYKRTDKCELADATKEVGAHFRKVRKELRKNCADAETAIADGKTADALTALREALKTGVVGYDEANKAVELYNKLIEDGRKAMKGADAAKLKQLAETYKDTDLATEIAEASKKVNN